jgi:hypothetical protein
VNAKSTVESVAAGAHVGSEAMGGVTRRTAEEGVSSAVRTGEGERGKSRGGAEVVKESGGSDRDGVVSMARCDDGCERDEERGEDVE